MGALGRGSRVIRLAVLVFLAYLVAASLVQQFAPGLGFLVNGALWVGLITVVVVPRSRRRRLSSLPAAQGAHAGCPTCGRPY